MIKIPPRIEINIYLQNFFRRRKPSVHLINLPLRLFTSYSLTFLTFHTSISTNYLIKKVQSLLNIDKNQMVLMASILEALEIKNYGCRFYSI